MKDVLLGFAAGVVTTLAIICIAFSRMISEWITISWFGHDDDNES